MSTLIVGAAGAVGKRLVNALAARNIPIVATDRMPRLPTAITNVARSEANVDVRSVNGLRRVFQKHPDITSVWNLAAPLSLETAMDPKIAEEITIGGMRNVLQVMTEFDVKKICFTDSIGSFGAEAPRLDCTARWLTENPFQDPGSDYGLQKRGCRELMMEFAERGGTPRFAVLPGVLHSAALWGAGTTEYALEAMSSAVAGKVYKCPVDPDVQLPMIYVDDLMRGLVALQAAPENRLLEPQNGYAIPGLSFSANELFTQIQKHIPEARFEVEIDENANKFANLWPDYLSTKEAKRDLGYSPQVKLPEMVTRVLAAHFERNAEFADVFQAVDNDDDGCIAKDELHDFLAGLMNYEPSARGLTRSQTAFFLREVTDQAWAEIPRNATGQIGQEEWTTWSRRHTLKHLLEDFLKHKNSHSTMTGF